MIDMTIVDRGVRVYIALLTLMNQIESESNKKTVVCTHAFITPDNF
jgi:hypothetical protein